MYFYSLFDAMRVRRQIKHYLTEKQALERVRYFCMFGSKWELKEKPFWRQEDRQKWDKYIYKFNLVKAKRMMREYFVRATYWESYLYLERDISDIIDGYLKIIYPPKWKYE